MDVVSKDDVLSQGEDPGMSDGEGLVSDSSIGIGQDPERRRVATVYDAVAGKAMSQFIGRVYSSYELYLIRQ